MAYTRIERLQNAMANSGFDGALIVSPEDRLYFTQFPSSDGYLLVSAEKAVFVTDSRYVEAAEKKAVGCSVVLQTTDSTQLFELFSEMHVTRVAVEASRMNLAQYARICNALEPMAVLADSTLDNLIAGLRSVKQPDEIEKSARRKRSPNKLSRIFVSLSNPAKPSVKCHWNWISLCCITVPRHCRLKRLPSAAKTARCPTVSREAEKFKPAILSRWTSARSWTATTAT